MRSTHSYALAGMLTQVAQLRRTVTKNGKKTVEVVYLITSDRDAEPAAAVVVTLRAGLVFRRCHVRHGRLA